jgi:hypothetical protein
LNSGELPSSVAVLTKSAAALGTDRAACGARSESRREALARTSPEILSRARRKGHPAVEDAIDPRGRAGHARTSGRRHAAHVAGGSQFLTVAVAASGGGLITAVVGGLLLNAGHIPVRAVRRVRISDMISKVSNVTPLC